MNRTSKFPPGLYRMRNGECAELLAERNGFFYGTGTVNTTPFQWFPNGNHVGSDGYDLLYPWIEADPLTEIRAILETVVAEHDESARITYVTIDRARAVLAKAGKP